MIQIFGHAKCKATKAAGRFFAERGLKVHAVDVREKGLSKGELASVARAVGGIAKLWDAQGTRVKERGLQHSNPSEERMATLLLEDATLLRTPIVRLGQKATVGDDAAGWKALAIEAKAAR
jgi:arsenate reductase